MEYGISGFVEVETGGVKSLECYKFRQVESLEKAQEMAKFLKYYEIFHWEETPRHGFGWRIMPANSEYKSTKTEENSMSEYKFRGFSSNCVEEENLYGVSGNHKNEFGESSGVQEWCTSAEDAAQMMEKMLQYPSEFTNLKIIRWKDYDCKEIKYTQFEFLVENMPENWETCLKEFLEKMLQVNVLKGSLTITHPTEEELISEVESSVEDDEETRRYG